MKVLVETHYGDRKLYEGSPIDIEHGMLRDYPWLGYLKTHPDSNKNLIWKMLKTLARSQIYEVKMLDSTMADGIEYGDALYKAVKPEQFSHFVVHSPGDDNIGKKFDFTKEYHPHQQLAEAYKKHVLDSQKPISTDKEKNLRGISPKVVYSNVPTHLGESKFLVKPYFSPEVYNGYSAGWQEMTSQALYHAGGIGDLHQKVHMAMHPMDLQSWKTGESEVRDRPALVIHLAPGHESVTEKAMDYSDRTYPEEHEEQNKESAKKMHLMDFLMNQIDRHGSNVMLNKETGAPLAIDNSFAFDYNTTTKPKPEDFLDYYRDNAFYNIAPLPAHLNEIPKFFTGALNWWKDNSSKIRQEFVKRTDMIKDPVYRANIERGFHDRAAILDRMAEESPNTKNLGIEKPNAG